MNKVTRVSDQKGRRPLLKSIIPGEHVRLREDILRHVRPREWIFKRVEDDGTVLLVHESGGFGWNVKIDQIDWEAYQKQKNEK